MGTHGTVRVLNENGKLEALFATQFDGFPDQLGRELVHGLVGKRYVHGYSSEEDTALLVGDLVIEVAWILQHYRGNMHIGFLPLDEDTGEGWGVYTVYTKKDEIFIRHAPDKDDNDDGNQDEDESYDGIADPKKVPVSWNAKTPPETFDKRHKRDLEFVKKHMKKSGAKSK